MNRRLTLSSRAIVAVVTACVLALGLTACGAASPTTAPSTPRPTPTSDAGVQPSGNPIDIVTGLMSPWSILRTPGDEASSRTFVSERDTGTVELRSMMGMKWPPS